MKLISLRKCLPALLALTAGASLLFAFTEGVPINAICPVTQKPADPGQKVPYTKEVKFCGEACKTRFNQNPDEKVQEIATASPEVNKCLMCDKPADPEIKTTYSRLVAMSDAASLPAFTANPDKFIVFAVTHPRPVNAICPITGRKVDPACTATFQKTVLFCSKLCRDDFSRAPDKKVDRIVKFAREADKCLLCDNKYDATQIEIYRRSIGFSNPASAEIFKADPDAHLTKAIESGK